MLKSIAITTQETLSLAFGALPLVLFLFKKNKQTIPGVLFIYILGSFATDCIILYDAYVRDIVNSTKWLRGFTLFELTVFSIYFSIVLNSKWFRVFIAVGFAVFLYAFIRHWNSTSEKFDSIPASIGAIICIIFSLFYLYHTASDPKRAGKGFFNSRFWFAIGIMIYMAGNLFMFVTFNSFKAEDAIKLSAVIFPLMNIMKNIFFSIGMLQKEE